MRKNFNKLFALAAMATAFTFSSCEGDPELDPLQFQNVKSGSMMTLRSTSYANRNNKAFVGGVDTFNVLTAVQNNPNFSVITDFVSENFSDLQSVDYYTVNKGVRTKVYTALPAEFADVPNQAYKRATVKIPFKTLLGSRNICEFTPSDPASGAGSGIDIEADINLSNGTIVPASAVVNAGLLAAAAFYPAHSMRYTAVGPVIAPQKVFLASGDSVKANLLSFLPAADRSKVTSFKWVAEDNPSIKGEILTGSTSNAFNGGRLVNETTRKQSVIYSVTPVLSNGCNGRPFTITTAFCDPSDIGGTFDGETTAFGGWEGGKTVCTSKWTGKVILEEGLEGIYNVKTVFNATNTFDDFSFGSYYVCYGTNTQAGLPNKPGSGDLRLTHSCDALAATGKSQYGEIYTIKDVKPAGKLLTFTWTNDYGEGAITKLTRTDGKDWPATIK
jgi:hypothetical protein